MNPSFLTEDRYRDAVYFLVNASVFLFFSLLLATKYGHSLAMVLMLVATLLAIPLKRNSKIPKEIKFACEPRKRRQTRQRQQTATEDKCRPRGFGRQTGQIRDTAAASQTGEMHEGCKSA